MFYTYLTYSNFLAIIKMFELNIDSKVAAKQLGLNRNTTNRMYTLLRKIISDYSNEVDCTYQKLLEDKKSEFGVTIMEGKVNIQVIDKSELPDSVFSLIRKRDPNNNKTFHFDYKRIKHLMHNDDLEKFPTEADHFFRFMKESLLKYRGTKMSHLFLYLKELEFRYNNSNVISLFFQIVEKIAVFEGWSEFNHVSKK